MTLVILSPAQQNHAFGRAVVLGVSGQQEWAGWDTVLAVLVGAFPGQVLLPGLTAPSSTWALCRALLIFGTPRGTHPCSL